MDELHNHPKLHLVILFLRLIARWLEGGVVAQFHDLQLTHIHLTVLLTLQFNNQNKCAFLHLLFQMRIFQALVKAVQICEPYSEHFHRSCQVFHDDFRDTQETVILVSQLMETDWTIDETIKKLVVVSSDHLHLDSGLVFEHLTLDLEKDIS